MLGRERQGQDVVVGEQSPHVLRELAGLVDLGGPRRDPLVGQDADGVAEHLVLVGQADRARGRGSRSVTGGHPTARLRAGHRHWSSIRDGVTTLAAGARAATGVGA